MKLTPGPAINQPERRIVIKKLKVQGGSLYNKLKKLHLLVGSNIKVTETKNKWTKWLPFIWNEADFFRKEDQRRTQLLEIVPSGRTKRSWVTKRTQTQKCTLYILSKNLLKRVSHSVLGSNKGRLFRDISDCWNRSCTLMPQRFNLGNFSLQAFLPEVARCCKDLHLEPK